MTLRSCVDREAPKLDEGSDAVHLRPCTRTVARSKLIEGDATATVDDRRHLISASNGEHVPARVRNL